jgi:hypothetical protein
MFLFADDASGLKASDNLSELIDKCNTEIQKLANWFRANKMSVNASKTKFIIFHTRGKKVDLQNKTLVFNNNEIGKNVEQMLITPLEGICNSNVDHQKRAFKLLGVYFDENLSFNYRVNYLCSKLSKSLFFLNRAKNFVDTKSMTMLYYTLIHSNLLYCIGTISVMNQTNFKKIKLIQKKPLGLLWAPNPMKILLQFFMN